MSKKDKCFPSNSSYESEKLVRRRIEGGKGVREGEFASESEEKEEEKGGGGEGEEGVKGGVKGLREMRRRICSEKLF